VGGHVPKELLMSKRPQRRVAGFTIVEMLVVVGILALLLGVLLPALSGAQKKSDKLKELNALKQVDLAWRLYATASAERAVPGFLEKDVQERWKVSFEYRNQKLIPPASTYSDSDANIAGPWTWRLLPYLDFNYQMVQGHLEELYTEGLDLAASGADPVDVVNTAGEIAYGPGFGYNAYYVGGWWEMVGDLPRYRFRDATVNGRAKGVVRTSIAQIKRSSEVITFCSSSILPKGTYRRFRRDQAGWHWVSPPLLGGALQWSISDTTGHPCGLGRRKRAPAGSDDALTARGPDPTVLAVVADFPDDDRDAVGVPIGRYNRLVAVLHADGHASAETPGALLDMRRWIDAADVADFEHQ
jgi:type II secretory pathway pseudopilin PulG